MRILPAAVEAGFRVRLTYVPWPEYVSGLHAKLPASIDRLAVRVPDPDAMVRAAQRRNGLIKAAAATLRVISRPLIVLRDVLRLRSALQGSAVDVMHINNGGFPGALSCNAAAIAARIAGIRQVVYVVNNLAVDYRRPFRWVDWPVDRLVTRCVSVFVTGSGAARERLMQVLAVSPDRCIAVPNTVIEPTCWPDRDLVRAELGLEPTADVLAVVARLEERKGHRYLLDALARLRRSGHPRTTLLVAGDGPLKEALAKEAARLGLGSAVRFLGSVTDVWSVYRAADVVVLPSIGHEDFPVTILEAMAASRPVVVSRVAGTPEQVEHEVTGILVPAGDGSALACALSSLLREPTRRALMGVAARRSFEKNFAADVVTQRYIDVYRALLHGRTSG